MATLIQWGMTESYWLPLPGLADHSQFLTLWSLMYWRSWVYFCLCVWVSVRCKLKERKESDLVCICVRVCVCVSGIYICPMWFVLLPLCISYVCRWSRCLGFLLIVQGVVGWHWGQLGLSSSIPLVWLIIFLMATPSHWIAMAQFIQRDRWNCISGLWSAWLHSILYTAGKIISVLIPFPSEIMSIKEEWDRSEL